MEIRLEKAFATFGPVASLNANSSGINVDAYVIAGIDVDEVENPLIKFKPELFGKSHFAPLPLFSSSFWHLDGEAARLDLVEDNSALVAEL
jgi:hypothetical protein